MQPGPVPAGAATEQGSKAEGSVITENKSKRSLCTAESAGSCSGFRFPEEKLKCESTAEQQRLVFVGGMCCFPEKTREPRTRSTDFSVLIFPSLLKLNLTKVQAAGDALNHALIFHILFENKKGSKCKSGRWERGYGSPTETSKSKEKMLATAKEQGQLQRGQHTVQETGARV